MEIKSIKEEGKTTLEVVFTSGRKVKIQISEGEQKLDWIQMFFYNSIVPNTQTFGKVAKKLYIKKEYKSIAFHLRDTETQVI